jgi:RHS repeat-associated protein
MWLAVRNTAPEASITRYLYHGDDLLMEVDGAGNPLREYTYLPGVDRPHSVRISQTGATYYYATDYPGNVIALVDGANQVANEYKYGPWGEPELVSETVTQPLRYTAREWDATAGLYQVRARWYDPQTGRFVSEDPIGLAGGINPYAYAANSPVNFTDPSGLCPDAEISLQGITVYSKPGGCDDTEPNVESTLDYLRRMMGGARPGLFGDVDFSYLRHSAREVSRFSDRAHEVRISGHREFPLEPNSETRHACASYVLASEFGGWSTRLFGIANEVQGFVRWDIPNFESRLSGRSAWAFQLDDLRSNEMGIAANALGIQLPSCERVR